MSLYPITAGKFDKHLLGEFYVINLNSEEQATGVPVLLTVFKRNTSFAIRERIEIWECQFLRGWRKLWSGVGIIFLKPVNSIPQCSKNTGKIFKMLGRASEEEATWVRILSDLSTIDHV